jgi:hypothetical protein
MKFLPPYDVMAARWKKSPIIAVNATGIFGSQAFSGQAMDFQLTGQQP